MKTKHTHLLAMIFLITLCFSCKKESMVVNTHMDIYQSSIGPSLEALQTDLANIETVGRLVLKGANIPDLSVLRNMRSIGYLSLNGCTITNLNGIENVNIKGIDIHNCHSLQNLYALERINELGVFTISACNSLTHIKMPELAKVKLQDQFAVSYIRIDAMPNLLSLELPALAAVEGFLDISSCDNLQNIYFPSLEYVENLTLYGNRKLENLNGFAKLNQIGGEEAKISINFNKELIDIQGLSNLSSAKEIRCSSNQRLEDFCPLKNVVLNNENLKLQINGIDRPYFDDCN